MISRASHRSSPSPRSLACATAIAALTACADQQSSLSSSGPDAERIVTISWILFIGAGAILTLVVSLVAIALRGPENWRSQLAQERVVIGGGIIFPIVTLSILLIYTLLLMRAEGNPSSGGPPIHISVIGKQWWWQVIYHDGDHPVESANELRIPTGRTIELSLTTSDVIHSFWVPNLAGKVDMIPGRVNKLRFTADKTGISRGQCAEYCGGAHALMSFHVIVMEPDEYSQWRQREAATAPLPSSDVLLQGQSALISSGCGACHTIRGTPANGKIGPDLTHVGGRHSLAAGTLKNDRSAFASWISDNQHIKPENLMPPFNIFDDEELMAIAAYLESLK